MTTNHLTIDEAAAISKMSKAWWRKQIFERKVKHIKIGRRVFILKSTIEELMVNGVVEPVIKDSIDPKCEND